MKVIHYIPSLDIGSGGTTTYIRLLGEELGKMSELHIVSHRSDHPAAVRNCTVHYIGKDMLYGMTQWGMGRKARTPFSKTEFRQKNGASANYAASFGVGDLCG